MDIVSTSSSRYQKRGREPVLGHAAPSYRHGDSLVTRQPRVFGHGRKEKTLKAGSRATRASRRWKARTSHIRWDPDEPEDGRGLASDPSIALPGERHYRNTPRLERQEAFRAPKAWEADIVVDDAELYRLGILYDDDNKNGCENNELERSANFCLDAIVHAEPVYSLRAANNKRVKRVIEEDYRPRRFSLLSAEELMLSVELLSQRLEEEAAIKRLLAPVAAGDDAEGTCDDSIIGNDDIRYYHSGASAQPLTVIYELIEGSTTTTPASINTAQAAAGLPDLISDAEDSESIVTEWDVVPTFHRTDDSASSGDAAVVAAAADDDDLGETGTEMETEMTAETAADDAWVVIAGDDS